MRRRNLFAIFVLFFALLSPLARGGTYTLSDGQALSGDPISYNESGLIVRQSDGSVSARTPWEKFTEDALNRLMAEAKTPKDKSFIEPFLDNTVEKKAEQRKITIKEVPKPPRPAGDLGIFAAFSSPVFILILFAIFVGNLYAAYEIAFYKNRPPGMVCGISAIVPVIGPIIFLCLPPNEDPMRDTTADAPHEPVVEDIPVPEEAHAAPIAAADETPGATAAPTAQPSHRPNFKLAQEEPAPAAPALPPPVVFKRGEFSFNRRFFETKMPGFFRVVPGEAERDMVLVFKAARGEFIGKRITNVTQSELHLQVFKDNATHDEMIPFNEIQEVTIRHKDAVA